MAVPPPILRVGVGILLTLACFFYDLDIWAQGQALMAFVVVIFFSTTGILSKVFSGILIKHDRKLHKHLEHDLFYFCPLVELHHCLLCKAKSSYLANSEKYKNFILFLLARNLPEVMIINLLILGLC